MSKGELSFALKRYIVQRLACFDTPSQVAAAVKAEFAAELTRQRVGYYDPTSKMGAALPADLKTLFEETRAAFLKQIDAIPIANKAVQMRALDRALIVAEERKQLPLVVEIVGAASKLAGTVVNKHEVAHTVDPKTSARDRVFKRLDDIRGRMLAEREQRQLASVSH